MADETPVKQSEFRTFKSHTDKQLKDIKDVVKPMQTQVQELHDFMIDSKAFERGKGANGQNINISPDVWKLLLLLVGTIIAFVGGGKIAQ